MKLMRRNLSVLAAVSFFVFMFPYVPVAIIIFEKLAGSYALGMGVFALMSLTTVLLEVPTGVLSDKWGRKKVLSVGCFLSFLNVVAIAIAQHTDFSLFFLYCAALLQGTANALYSGNNEALIYETAVSIKRTHVYPKIIGRMGSMTQAGLALTGIISGLTLFVGFGYEEIVLLSVISSFILFLLTLFVVEPPRHYSKEKHGIRHIMNAFSLIKNNKRLRYYSIANVIQSGGLNATYYLIPGFISTVWVGWTIPVFRTLQHIAGSIGFWFSGSFVSRFMPARVLIATSVAMNTFGFLAYAFVSVFSPFFVMLGQPFFAFWNTARSTIEQSSFSREQRATMGSLISLGGSVVGAVLSLLLGVLADTFSISTALLIVVIFRFLAADSLYLMVYKKLK